jgi:hypothetical protein
VPFAYWLSFAVLMSFSLCTRQLVSAPHWLAFFRYSDESLALHSTGGERPLLAVFLSLVRRVLHPALDRM